MSKPLTLKGVPAVVAIPGNEDIAYPILVYHGSTAHDLLEALSADPEFPQRSIKPEDWQVTFQRPDGQSYTFERREQLRPTIREGEILELMSANAPQLGDARERPSGDVRIR